MPAFILKDERHFIAYITGPSHVLLGIRFTGEPAEPMLFKQPAIGSGGHGMLDEDQIRAAVHEALAEIRAEGMQVHASEIIYVEDDSPRYNLYRHAARLLVRHYALGGAFKPSDG